MCERYEYSALIYKISTGRGFVVLSVAFLILSSALYKGLMAWHLGIASILIEFDEAV